ncbi:hypothetical protein GmHk_15G044995 [Glycine max]|nr:hypothetical protein GmHk_15G044995 [Glycine max]
MLIMSKLTIEEHGEWREMANMMQNVAVPPNTIFQTVHARDQIFGEVSKVYAVRWNNVLDDVVYNKDLDQPAIVAGMFQATCIIFLKTKAELICTWRTLQNVGLCSIIGGRHLKLELDANIFVKPCP